MHINHLKKGEITIISINGRLDAVMAPVADKAIRKIFKTDSDCSRVLIDFSTLDDLSAGGLQVILRAVRGLKRKEGQIALCCLPEYIKDVFEVSGFDSLTPISDTVASGIERLT